MMALRRKLRFEEERKFLIFRNTQNLESIPLEVATSNAEGREEENTHNLSNEDGHIMSNQVMPTNKADTTQITPPLEITSAFTLIVEDDEMETVEKRW